MYLQTELTNKVKELYFKYLKVEGITINFYTNELDYLEIGACIKKVERLDMPLGLKNAIIWIYSDLFQVLTNDIDTNSIFLSNLAKNTNNKIKIAEMRTFKAVETLSEETTQLIDDMKCIDGSFYIVGGFVRDAIAGRESNDVDFCTDVNYDVLEKKLTEKGWDVKDTGKQFLVLNVSKGNENFEIAALRSDKDNNGPVVGTIEEDSLRRDFVNSCIYFSLKTETLIDPSGMAIKDCQENRLRFMGKAKDRIQEDSARVFRGYKMIGRGWKPETKTLKAMRENFEFAITNTNSTRIMNEIEKIVF